MYGAISALCVLNTFHLYRYLGGGNIMILYMWNLWGDFSKVTENKSMNFTGKGSVVLMPL